MKKKLEAILFFPTVTKHAIGYMFWQHSLSRTQAPVQTGYILNKDAFIKQIMMAQRIRYKPMPTALDNRNPLWINILGDI